MYNLTEIEKQEIVSSIKHDLATGFTQMNPDKWKSHWENKVNELSKLDKITIDNLRPNYDTHTIYRLNKKLIKASNDFEHNQNIQIRLKIFNKFITENDIVYDFGCGSCLNAMLLKNTMTCLDVVDPISKILHKINQGASFTQFNMLEPKSLNLNNKIVITCHSMEQIGTNFTDFIDMLRLEKPKLCIHLEPLVELYNNDELDNLAKQYHYQRNYLGHIIEYINKYSNIIHLNRSFFGTKYHEGYSLLVWQP